MSKYIWCWKDSEALYTNKADNLEEIIYEILDYYFYSGSGNGEDKGIGIKEINDHFNISFAQDGGSSYEFQVKAIPEAVANFLEEIAELADRKDKFDIQKV